MLPKRWPQQTANNTNLEVNKKIKCHFCTQHMCQREKSKKAKALRSYVSEIYRQIYQPKLKWRGWIKNTNWILQSSIYKPCKNAWKCQEVRGGKNRLHPCWINIERNIRLHFSNRWLLSISNCKKWKYQLSTSVYSKISFNSIRKRVSRPFETQSHTP